MFWYDRSCGMHQPFRSRNIFVHLSTCLRACQGINPDPSQLVYVTSPPAPTTIQPFHPHLHTRQHTKHKHLYQLPLDYHPSISVAPIEGIVRDIQEIYPESTLATPPPTVRPSPKPTAPIKEHKTVGAIQAMFTISKTPSQPINESDILKEPTGSPLDDEDLQIEDLTNSIEFSDLNSGGVIQEVSMVLLKIVILQF